MNNIYVIIRTTSDEPYVGFAIRAFDTMEAANEYMVTLAQEIFQMRNEGDKTIEVDENCTAQIEWNDGEDFDWLSIDKVEFVRSPDDAT
jgi:hypothetical protein